MYCDPPGPGQVMHISAQARRYRFACTDSCVQDRRYRFGYTHSCVQVRTYRTLCTDSCVPIRMYRFVGTDSCVQARRFTKLRSEKLLRFIVTFIVKTYTFLLTCGVGVFRGAFYVFSL